MCLRYQHAHQQQLIEQQLMQQQLQSDAGQHHQHNLYNYGGIGGNDDQNLMQSMFYFLKLCFGNTNYHHIMKLEVIAREGDKNKCYAGYGVVYMVRLSHH